MKCPRCGRLMNETAQESFRCECGQKFRTATISHSFSWQKTKLETQRVTAEFLSNVLVSKEYLSMVRRMCLITKWLRWECSFVSYKLIGQEIVLHTPLRLGSGTQVAVDLAPAIKVGTSESPFCLAFPLFVTHSHPAVTLFSRLRWEWRRWTAQRAWDRHFRFQAFSTHTPLPLQHFERGVFGRSPSYITTREWDDGHRIRSEIQFAPREWSPPDSLRFSEEDLKAVSGTTFSLYRSGVGVRPIFVLLRPKWFCTEARLIQIPSGSGFWEDISDGYENFRYTDLWNTSRMLQRRLKFTRGTWCTSDAKALVKEAFEFEVVLDPSVWQPLLKYVSRSQV